MLVKRGTTSKLARVFVGDAASPTGAGLTGLVYNSSGLTAYYAREGAASATAITLATMTVGTWASGGFKEIDATNMPGWYELGIPDAAIGTATTAATVTIHLKGAANMVPASLTIDLVAFDPQATSMGLSLAKTTNITGFNDIAATAIVSSGAITTSGGAVSTVTTTGTATNVTTLNGIAANVITATSIAANAITSAKIAASAITSTQAPNLDAAVSSRMATFTLPANFSAFAINGSGRIDVGNWQGAPPRALNGDLLEVHAATIDSAATGDIADAVWDEVLSGHQTAGTAGKSLSNAGGGATAQDVWEYPARTLTGGTSYVQISEGYSNGSIEIRKGDSYSVASGKRITITKPSGASWPSDLASLPWTVTFTATKISTEDGTAASTLGPITCTVNSATSVDVPLTAAQTAALVLNTAQAGNQWQWDLQAANGLLRNTLVSGTMTVLPEITTG